MELNQDISVNSGINEWDLRRKKVHLNFLYFVTHLGAGRTLSMSFRIAELV